MFRGCERLACHVGGDWGVSNFVDMITLPPSPGPFPQNEGRRVFQRFSRF